MVRSTSRSVTRRTYQQRERVSAATHARVPAECAKREPSRCVRAPGRACTPHCGVRGRAAQRQLTADRPTRAHDARAWCRPRGRALGRQPLPARAGAATPVGDASALRRPFNTHRSWRSDTGLTRIARALGSPLAPRRWLAAALRCAQRCRGAARLAGASWGLVQRSHSAEKAAALRAAARWLGASGAALRGRRRLAG